MSKKLKNIQSLQELLECDADFIEQYCKASNASTGSFYDANANVQQKNVVTLAQELPKGINIMRNRSIMKKKIAELYDADLAEQYLKDLDSHVLYKHDESASAGVPYTYSAKEVIEVMYKGRHLLTPFDLLWETVEEDAVLVNEEDNVYQKAPSDLMVKDIDGYTKVTVMTKKERRRDLVRVKTAFGEDVVVTDNHPMIVDRDNVDLTVHAIDSEGQRQFKIDDELVFGGNSVVDTSACPGVEHFTEVYCMTCASRAFRRYVNLSEELGYFVGFFVGDGNYNNAKDNGSIVITQKEESTLRRLNDILFKEIGICGNIRYKRDKSRCFTLSVASDVLWWLLSEYFMIQDKSQHKTLPCNILETNEEFAKGVMAGLMDADGTVNGTQLSIRLSSRSAVLQATSLLRHFGYGVGNTFQSIPFSPSMTEIQQKYGVWGVNCSPRTNCVPFPLSYKLQRIQSACDSSLKYHKGGDALITNVSKVAEDDAFLALNDFIYDITTETHTFACNNLLVHNCVAITMYPFLTDGLTKIGGISTPPTDTKSYCGEFVNLVFSIASQFAGAVATPEFLMYMDYFLRKDYGEDYVSRIGEVVEATVKQRTLSQVIDNYFQQVVHSMNMPTGARGYQTVFWNIGYFDKPYFDGVFGDFRFPDGTAPKWETLSWLQKHFMNWFNEERSKYVLTFPVETMALLTDGNDDFVDKEYADFTAEMWSKGHSFFCYLSDSPDSLSSCCFCKDTKVLWKSSTSGVHLTSLEELHNTKWEPEKKNLKIFHNGSWVAGKSIKLPNRKMYKVTTLNNKEFFMTDNHINLTLRGEVETKDITTDDYLMFNTQVLNAVPENDEHLTYEQGFVVGAFLGDGSFGCEVKGCIYETNFSQNIDKYQKCMEMIDKCAEQMGIPTRAYLSAVYNNVYPVHISSKELVAFIQRWTLWERGTYAYNKKLNLDCLLQSVEFRKGILDGWYNTDGGNSNRCYTTSKELAEDMEALITSLGMNSIINVSDRTDEPCEFRGISYSRNYPLYCVRWYESCNHRSNKDACHAWVKRNNSIYFKVASIEEVDYSDDVYCIECRNQDEPYFTLPSGLITHNCRLRNSISRDKTHNVTTHQYSMGTASVATGSKSVMTINLNRLVQDAFNNGDNCTKERTYANIMQSLDEMVTRVHKYQHAFNEILKDFYKAHMLPVYEAGFISMKKQYLTIGVNGLTDAAKFLNIEPKPCDEYHEFVNNILETINKCNRRDKTPDLMFNTEFVPGENLSHKNYEWDRKAGYKVSKSHNMYSSYFYDPEDTSLTIIDKFKLHGKEYVQYLDGGSALHMNLDEHLSKEQYRQLMKAAAHYGTNYFTYNVRNTVCNDCGYISKNTEYVCPKCGSENIDYLTRVIGYLKRVSNFSEARQKEAKIRYYDGEPVKIYEK